MSTKSAFRWCRSYDMGWPGWLKALFFQGQHPLTAPNIRGTTPQGGFTPKKASCLASLLGSRKCQGRRKPCSSFLPAKKWQYMAYVCTELANAAHILCLAQSYLQKKKKGSKHKKDKSTKSKKSRKSRDKRREKKKRKRQSEEASDPEDSSSSSGSSSDSGSD
eukprot:1139656-Pelagomonas_calceolata.AAC.1